MKWAIPQEPLFVEDVCWVLNSLRAAGKSIVTTNGCFDLLHAGHVQYLTEAASYGDVLVVGINSDASVRLIKGLQRPIQKEYDRMLLVGALKVVDYAFIFNEPDPCTFIDQIKPDVHVKGGDYRPEQLPETAVVEKWGGRVVIVGFAPGYSTSGIVAKIQAEVGKAK